jgi:hypothetical protein
MLSHLPERFSEEKISLSNVDIVMKLIRPHIKKK